jgi:glutamate/tyrosine decarboxylase-like PLP-dependent enzyme
MSTKPSPDLHANAALMEDIRNAVPNTTLFEQAKHCALEYMSTVRDRRVYPGPQELANLQVFQEPLPDRPVDGSAILEMLHQTGSPATVAQTGGRYFGFVVGSALPAALAVKWLVDVWDQNAGMFVGSPITSTLESVCERWLKDLLRLPESTVAGFVTGSAMATFCGLAAGRDELLRRAGWDAGAQGLFGAPPIRVVLGAQAHSTVFKALALLGLGRERVIVVPSDYQGRMRVEHCPKLDDRTLLVLQAGHVSTGAFDSFQPICAEARRAGSWVHVDGAIGLWAAASAKYAHLTKGIEQADSWSVDAHKTLNAPYDNGIILCRHREALARSMQLSGSYIVYSEQQRDPMIFTPEMSRRARGVELWATLKALGRNGVEAIVDELCDNARYFAEGLAREGFLIRNEVCFNQVLVSCGSSDLTRATLAGIQESGECWCGGADWEGEPVIRISVCSFMTTRTDVDRSIAAFCRARAQAN